MLLDSLLLLYSAAIGFVAAGIVASFYKMMTEETARFRLLGTTFWAALTTFLFCALSGPFIIMQQAVAMMREERNAVGWFAASFFIAALWSCCSGILVLELVLDLKSGLA